MLTFLSSGDTEDVPLKSVFIFARRLFLKLTFLLCFQVTNSDQTIFLQVTMQTKYTPNISSH